MDLIGKTLNQAQQLLKCAGIEQVVCKNNFKNQIPNSTLIVTAYKIIDKTAHLTLGSFKLDI